MAVPAARSFPAIPEFTGNDSQATVRALKEAVEILVGARGDGSNAATSGSIIPAGTYIPYTDLASPIAPSSGYRPLHVNSSGRFAVPKNVYNVQLYGATGDGSTNDYTALQAALTAVPDGGTLYLPAGVYVCGSKLTCSNKSITILGDGGFITTIRFTSASSAGLEINLRRNFPNHPDVANVKGLRIQNYVASSTQTGLNIIVDVYSAHGWQQCWVSDVYITPHDNATASFAVAMRFENVVQAFIRDVSLVGSQTAGTTGLQIKQCIGFTVSGIQSVGWGWGMRIEEGASHGVEGVYVSDFYLYGCATALYIQNAVGLGFSNGHLLSGGVSGSQPGWVVRGIQVAQCNFTNILSYTTMTSSVGVAALWEFTPQGGGACEGNVLSNIQIIAVGTANVCAGIYWNGSCWDNVMNNIVMQVLSTGLSFTVGADHNIATNIVFHACTTATVNSGSGNVIANTVTY